MKTTHSNWTWKRKSLIVREEWGDLKRMFKFKGTTRSTEVRNSNYLRRKRLKRIKWCLINVRTRNQMWTAIKIELRFVNLIKESWIGSWIKGLESWKGFPFGSILTWREKEFLEIDWRQILSWTGSLLKLTLKVT